MRAGLLMLLALVLLPGAATAEDPDPRPLCDGAPIVEIRDCQSGASVHVCGGHDQLRGLGCFIL